MYGVLCAVLDASMFNTKIVCIGLLLVFCTTGIKCTNTCENQITLAAPRHDYKENNDKIFILSFDQLTNNTKCSWTFSTAENFVLNLQILNFTSLHSSAGSDCKKNYALIKSIDSETNKTTVVGPYCGQVKNGFRVHGVINIELVAEKPEYSDGFSLSILIEASSKSCGGIVTNTSGGIPINFDAFEFGMSRSNFAHCVWYFELSTLQSLHLFVSKYTFYHDTHYKCAYYKEFMAIRTWNSTTGGHRKESFYCKKRNYDIPMSLAFTASNRFAVVIHFERVYNADGEISNVLFLANPGQPNTPIEVQGNGNVTREQLFHSSNATQVDVMLTSLRPRLDGKQVFTVVEAGAGVCRLIKMESWYFKTDLFHKNLSQCNDPEKSMLVLPKTETMAIFYFQAQMEFLRSVQLFFFSSATECGGLFDLQSTQNISIASPKASLGKYPPSLDCQWSFLAAQSTVLNISIDYMDLEDCTFRMYDYVEIYLGFRNPLQRHAKICTAQVKSFNLTGDVTIRFHSDSVVQKTGFRITVARVQDSQEVITTQSSTINSTPHVSTSKSPSTEKQSTKSECCTTKQTHSTIHKKSSKKSSEKSIKANRSSDSQTFYAIGISLGSLALVCFVGLAIIYFRRKKVVTTPACIVSNEMYLSNTNNDSSLREEQIDNIPLEHVYDYAQARTSGNAELENTYDYPKNSSIPLRENGDIVYERMDSQTYHCSPRNVPLSDQYVCPAAPPTDEAGESRVFESPEAFYQQPITNDAIFQSEVIYQQPNGPDIAYEAIGDEAAVMYSSISNDHLVPPEQA